MSGNEKAWDIVVAESATGKKVFRIMQALPASLVQSEFPECVIIEWKYGAGLPDQAMGAQLTAFENLLDPLDDPAGGSFQVMAITGNGKREWVYYAKDYDAFMRTLNSALVGKPRFPIGIEHSADVEWRYWSKIREFLKDAELESGETPTASQVSGIQQTSAFEATGKKLAANAFKLMQLKLADYALADAREFGHLHLPFYDTTSAALRALGFTHAIDAEPLDHTRSSGKRILMRFHPSQTEPICAAVFNIYPKPPGLFKRLFAKLGGRNLPAVSIGTLEFETEFSDGGFVTTSNSQGKNPFTKPPQFHSLQMAPDTPPGTMLETHRRRVAEHLKTHPGLQAIRVGTLEDIATQANRQRALKVAHRRAIGGITREELQALAKDKFPHIEQHAMAEMRRLIEEFDKKGGAGTAPAAPVRSTEVVDSFKDGGYARFLIVVQADFAGRGMDIVIDDGMAVVKSSGQRYGLQNLSQVCQTMNEQEWPAQVAHHFAVALKSFADVEAMAEKFKDFTTAAPLLSVRLYPADTMQGKGAEAPVMRTDLEGVASVLVFDLPESVLSVNRSTAKFWNKTDDELFAIARDWLRRDTSVEVSQAALKPDVQIHMAAGEGFYAASRALLLDEMPGFVGPYGAIVAIPHRHALLAYPIDGINVVQAIQGLLPAARGMHQQGPGSISSDLYWYRDGSFVRLPAQMTDNKLAFMPPDSFVALLNELAEKDARRA